VYRDRTDSPSQARLADPPSSSSHSHHNVVTTTADKIPRAGKLNYRVAIRIIRIAARGEVAI
jgi:hypothetical protein